MEGIFPELSMVQEASLNEQGIDRNNGACGGKYATEERSPPWLFFFSSFVSDCKTRTIARLPVSPSARQAKVGQYEEIETIII